MNPYRSPLRVPGRRLARSVRAHARTLLAGGALTAAAFASGYLLRPEPPPPLVEACPPPAAPPAPADAGAVAAEEPAHRTRYTIPSNLARATVAVRAKAALTAIGQRDFRALARFVDAEDGIQVSDIRYDWAASISRTELERCREDPLERVWDGPHTRPVTCAQFWENHVFSRGYGRPSHVDYNLPSAYGYPSYLVEGDGSPAYDITLQAHADDIVVQVVVRRPAEDVVDSEAPMRGWSSLQLVFRAYGDEWRLGALYWTDWSSDG